MQEVTYLQEHPEVFMLQLIWPYQEVLAERKRLVSIIPEVMQLTDIYFKVLDKQQEHYQLVGFLCSERLHCVAYFKVDQKWMRFDDERVSAM